MHIGKEKMTEGLRGVCFGVFRLAAGMVWEGGIQTIFFWEI